MDSKTAYAYLKKIFPFFLILFILGCNLPTGILPTPTAEAAVPETPSGPSEFAGTIAAAQTQAVEIAFQELTQTALSNPAATVTLRPSSTSAISATPLASFTPPPTVTPQPPATNTPNYPAVPIVAVTSAPSGPTRTPTQGAYQCKIVSQNPAWGTKLTKGVDFDLKVKLENIGTETWESGDNDFAYVNGVRFQRDRDALDLNKDVDPDESVSFVIDMVAPSDTGTQVARWRLGNFCTVVISVYVVP